MNKSVLFILFVLSQISNLWSQSESLTSSPYSLYGLGIHNNTLIGKWNGLSGAGLGYASSNEINPLNPASYAVLHKNGFWFDVGAKGGFNSYQNQRSSDRAIDFNFSDLAIGFSVTNRLGMGLTLLPYSSVGYTLSGIESNMEGSQETYYSNVNGYGGLNDLKWSVGYEIIKPLRIGLSTSFLFGNVHETEYLQVSSSYFYMEKNRFYKGIKLGLGMQFQPSDNFSIGSVIQFPTELNGSMTRDISKQVDGVEIVLEDAVAMETSNFELPLEMGVGVSYALFGQKIDFQRRLLQEILVIHLTKR
jgi:opacity protein-like surface antigen